MKKRYLKTPEDVMALKDTNTKIYSECEGGYYQFINGVLCAFDDDGDGWTICPTLNDQEEPYILEEEPEQEASKEDIGTLCWFWNKDYKDAELGILKEVSYDDDEVRYLSKEDYWYYHCRKLTQSEVAKLTGYKVSFADQSDAKVEEAE